MSRLIDETSIIDGGTPRARIERGLLLNLCAGGQVRLRGELEDVAIRCGLRRGLSILEDLGIGPDSFEEPDCQAIYIALQHGRDADTLTRAKYCRLVLRHLGMWRDDDSRNFIGGRQWGPTPLGRLFYSLPFRPERLVLFACRLLESIEQVNGAEQKRLQTQPTSRVLQIGRV
jgi:hypothetical protein